jgi:hypothetical protein
MNPAAPYFKNQNYHGSLVFCQNQSCGWFGPASSVAEQHACPFCGSQELAEREFLKPWGFAPRNGRAAETSDEDFVETSYAGQPSYSALPDEATEPTSFPRLRFANRHDCSLIIANTGPGNKGFDICRKCGAAFPSVNDKRAEKHIRAPYVKDAQRRDAQCTHDFAHGLVLSSTFNTDLALFELRLDPREVCVDYDNPWLKKATVSLAEAVRLAAVELLDIDSSELCVGSRRHVGAEATYVDIFLYDSLSSGAGYSSLLARQDVIEQVLDGAYNMLAKCTCETSCLSCLRHFGNKLMHRNLNRHDAIDLLQYVRTGKVRMGLRQPAASVFKPLASALTCDSRITVTVEGDSLLVANRSRQVEVRAIPNMANKSGSHLQFWEAEFDQNLPKVFDDVMKEVGRS